VRIRTGIGGVQQLLITVTNGPEQRFFRDGVSVVGRTGVIGTVSCDSIASIVYSDCGCEAWRAGPQIDTALRRNPRRQRIYCVWRTPDRQRLIADGPGPRQQKDGVQVIVVTMGDEPMFGFT